VQGHLSELGIVVDEDSEEVESKVGFRRIQKREEE
jgi:hypothetical protein